jgi:hypothetical protein
MLSKERLEAYRRMTPAEKWAETMELIDYGWQMLMTLPPEERERRLEIMRRERQAVNAAVAKALK